MLRCETHQNEEVWFVSYDEPEIGTYVAENKVAVMRGGVRPVILTVRELFHNRDEALIAAHPPKQGQVWKSKASGRDAEVLKVDQEGVILYYPTTLVVFRETVEALHRYYCFAQVTHK